MYVMQSKLAEHGMRYSLARINNLAADDVSCAAHSYGRCEGLRSCKRLRKKRAARARKGRGAGQQLGSQRVSARARLRCAAALLMQALRRAAWEL
jgi:hypothetical protein